MPLRRSDGLRLVGADANFEGTLDIVYLLRAVIFAGPHRDRPSERSQSPLEELLNPE